MKREQVKYATLASIASLPIMLGVGWVASIMADASIFVLLASKDVSPSEIERLLGQTGYWSMVPTVLVIWGFAAAGVIGLASLGWIPGPSMPRIPPPPPHRPFDGA